MVVSATLEEAYTFGWTTVTFEQQILNFASKLLKPSKIGSVYN